MTADTRASRLPDLRTGSAVSLVVHAALLLLLASAVTHTRAVFTPPTIRSIQLDVDVPAPVAAEAALVTPSASPVQAAVPQVAAPPRPALAPQSEERLAPTAGGQDLAPAAEDSVAPAGGAEAGGVTTFVATEATGKSLFGTGVDGLRDVLPAGLPSSAGSSGNTPGIEGPISLRRDMKPVYPRSARQRGEQGTVVLEAVVAPNGRATSVSIVTSSGFADLDRSARDAVEHAAYAPAQEDGRAVEARARITIIYKLTN